MRGRGFAVAWCIAVLPLAGCGGATDAPGDRGNIGDSGDRESSAPSSLPEELTGTLAVFAAASLTEVFTEFESKLEAQHPSLDVVLVFGGSSALAQQLLAGAPADVFAAADETTMQTAVDGAVVQTPVAFARNLLALAVPPNNPGGVTGLDDLARPELLIALCASEVPCGRAADRLLLKQGITPSVDTREQDVRSVLTKIELGEVDAGLIYATDARVATDRVTTDRVTLVPIAGADAVATTASISVVVGTSQPAAAAAFVALVTSAEGARVLSAAGFTGVNE